MLEILWSYELCLLMGVGASIVVIPDTYSAFPIKILQLMQQNNVSYIFWVPTIMVNIANMGLLSQVELPSLRVCWFAGEVFPTKQFNIWRHTLPNIKDNRRKRTNNISCIEIVFSKCLCHEINETLVIQNNTLWGSC